jgi:hypothetical protein
MFAHTAGIYLLVYMAPKPRTAALSPPLQNLKSQNKFVSFGGEITAMMVTTPKHCPGSESQCRWLL